MDDFNFIHSDSLDDVRGVEPCPLKPAPVAPALVPVASRRLYTLMSDRVALMTCDGEFLALVDPCAFVMREQWRVQARQAYAKGISQTGAYPAVDGASNHLRYTLHATGVI